MIDKKWLGHRLPSCSIEVEAGQIALFCKAIGETRPIHVDLPAARAAGHRGLIAPPTFAMGLEMLARKGGQYELLEQMGVVLGRGVHGEQGFTYHGLIYSGDVITFASELVDIYSKKGGALDFIVMLTQGVNQLGKLVIGCRNIAVARN